MNKLIGIALLLVATPVAAQQVTIDYAKDEDFKKVKTFQYTETKETNIQNPMMADRIVTDLKAKLTAGGLSEVQENPDIFVTYHMTSKQDQVLNTTSFGYGGVGMGWGAWGGGMGMGDSTTTETTYTEGTLILDAYRASDKKMIWRGKMGGKWAKILRNEGE